MPQKLDSFILLLVLFVGAASSACSGGTPPTDAGLANDVVHVDHAIDLADIPLELGPPRLWFVDGDGQETSRLRYGAPFSLRVSGVPPHSDVSLASRLFGYQGQGTFRADSLGRVETDRDAPLSGSYASVSSEGLLWSMERTSNAAAENLDLEVTLSAEGVTLSATLERAWLDEGLVRSRINEGGVVGELYVPASREGPLPAMMILAGSGGGIESASFQAAYLAGYGYASLAVAYFGEPSLPPELTEIPLEYFDDALRLLANHDAVDRDRVGVLGTSRGSEVALMIGGRNPIVKAVVAIAPSGVRWASVMHNDRAAWVAIGEDLPYLSGGGGYPEREVLPDGTPAYRLTPSFEATLDGATAETLDAVSIPVEEIRGPVLFLAGGADALWPSCRMAEMALQRLVSSGHSDRYDDEVRCFEDAGHVAPQPGWATGELYSPPGSPRLILGGTAQGNADAQRQGLAAMLDFLRLQLEP